MKKKILKNFYFILICLLVLIGVTFALFSANLLGVKEQIIDIAGLTFRYSEASAGISMVDIEPISDVEGKEQNTYFDFNIYLENTYNYAITYNIYLKETPENNLNPNYVKVYLTDQSDNQILPVSQISSLVKYPNDTNSYLLYTNTITPNVETNNNTQYYRLRMWLGDNYVEEITNTENGNTQTVEIEDKTFAFRVNVDNLTYEQDVTAPTIISATSPSALSTNRKSISIAANDNIGIKGYIIKDTNETPSIDDDWKITSATTYASDSIYTNGTYYVFVKDGSNNISTSTAVTVTNVRAEEPLCIWSGPTTNDINDGETSTFTLTCTDDDNVAFTDSTITLNDIIISNPNIINISNPVKNSLPDNHGYTYTFTVTGKNQGETYLVAKKNIVADADGNTNIAATKSSTIREIGINVSPDIVTVTSSYTNSTNVTLNINNPGATAMCVSTSQMKETDCANGSLNYESYATTKNYTLTGDDGIKNIYVYFDNYIAGMVSITLDRINPSCSLESTYPSTWTMSKTLTLTGSDDVSSNGYSFDGETYSSTNTLTVIANETYTAYVKDNAGNIGNCSIEVNQIDTVSPVISNASQSNTNYISYTVSDVGSGINSYLIKDTSSIPSVTDSNWISNTNQNATVEAPIITGDFYYLFIKDNANNISSYYQIEKNYPPTCSITSNYDSLLNTSTLTIISTDTDLNDNPYSWDNTLFNNVATKQINTNGTYTAYVKDEANNVGTCSIVVTNIVKNYLQPSTGSSDTTAFYAYRNQIKTITFEETVNVPATAVASWDVGQIHNGNVMAYIVTNTTDTTKYDLYIQGKGNINAPENSSYLLLNMKYVDAINNLSYFNTSNVRNMEAMFNSTGYNSTVFTLNLGENFNTSNVTNMQYMFNSTGYKSTVFTLDLGDNFNTSNVTNMAYMFASTGYNSTVFTLDLGNSFNTENVTGMKYMFYNTGYNSTVFTLDLGDNFNTSKVVDMPYMFYGTGCKCPVFTLDLGDNFNTSNVTNMPYMFASTGYKSTVFTLDLGDNFNTSKVFFMSYMFSYTGWSSTVFTLDLGDNFNTSKVVDMSYMFKETGFNSTAFTFDLGNSFNTSNVTNMEAMFNYTGYNSTVFTLDLGDNFNTSKVTDMSGMFYKAGYTSPVFTLDLGDNFNTSNVTNMSDMFSYTGWSSTVFTLDLGDNFNTSKVTDMSYMFDKAGYTSPVFTLDLGSNFNTSNVTNMNYMFYYTGYSSSQFNTIYLNNSSFNSSLNTASTISMIKYNNITTVYVKTAADKALLDAKVFTNLSGNTINVIVG